MQRIGSKEIREKFLNFFRDNDHQLIQGSSIIPKNDPTLLFINSGMAPMKNYFLGTQQPPYPRMANVQPCIRTNDIEDVGDRHHLTFFEMMGSWSIGDYYKEKATALAYDLLVNHFKFPPERLYATVYRGNEALGIPADEESIRCWQKAGMPADHIVPMGEDNFWGPAGDTGPCGPCTEVFFDTGDEFGPKYQPGGHFDDKGRYIEIWNAGVFMELNKDKDGKFSPLPMKSVDTGSGIERMYMALNGCESVYDVDTIKPVLDVVTKVLHSPELDTRDYRVVTDHLRTSSILLGEGIIPDKEGKGYIARRVLRKSIAIAMRAGQSPYVLKEAVEEVIRQLGDWYSYLLSNRSQILNVLEQEIKDFIPVVELGLQMLNDKISKSTDKTIPGDFAFELVATHGMPYEIIADFAAKKGYVVDEPGYEKAYRQHQEVSRAGTGKKIKAGDGSGSAISEAIANLSPTEFLGYDFMAADAKLLHIVLDSGLADEATEGANCQLIFDKTPFYAEAGGQVGDTGLAQASNVNVTITDTQKINGVYLHTATITAGAIRTGDILTLKVDAARRKDIEKNHTGTHLLHAGLRSVLGTHVVQRGSLVNDNKLRFDFAHNKPVTEEELKAIEGKINQWILEDYQTSTEEMAYQDAINSGAMALFNENYGSRVRVVQVGPVSTELCGGTHVKSASEIGMLLITQENSVAKGIRRVEAITGKAAYQYVTESRGILKSAASALSSSPENLVQNIQKLKSAKPKQEPAPKKDAGGAAFRQEKEIALHNGGKAFVGQLTNEAGVLQKIADDKTKQGFDIVLLLSAEENDIKSLVTVKTEAQDTYKADALLRNWLTPFNGRGGGKPALAKGGITDKNKMDEVFAAAEGLFGE